MLLKTRKVLRMTWPIDRLSLHPKQKQYFAAHTRERIVDLAKDIRANGLQERIEVTPKGRILSGWGRFLAVQELGWTEVPVLIRHDLVAKGTRAIEHRIIEANLNRRHLSKLSLARLYKAMRDLEGQGRQRRGQGKLRDEIGARLGMSGRQLDRLLQLLELPLELQQAMERKQIPAAAALHVAQLSPELQQEILATIRRGENPRRVVARLRALNPLDKKRRSDQTQRDIRDWLRLTHDLLQRAAEAAKVILPDQRNRLSEAESLLTTLRGGSGAIASN